MQNKPIPTASFALRVLWLASMAIFATPSIPAQDQEPPELTPPPAPPAPIVRAPIPGVVRAPITPGAASVTTPVAAPTTAPGTIPLPRRFQPPALSAEVTGDAEAKAPELKFENAPSDMVLQTYARETGRTLLISPDAPKANISLRSQTALNRREYLQAIQTVLRMNNIALLPVGDKFLKVVPVAAVLANAIETDFQEPEGGQHEDRGEVISQMIQLKYLTLEEASKALTPFKRGEGQIQIFERTNSLLLTDRTENVNRMLEIIHFLDKKHDTLEDVFPIQIKYAKASAIKTSLEAIVAESQKTVTGKPTPQANTSGAPGIRSVAAPLPMPVPGVVRAPTAVSSSINNPIIESFMDEAERGVIRGKVQILADERSNKLLFMTLPANMVFFNRIIEVLDIPTSPDVDVKVYRLEYADAEDVAKMINDLIGNTKQDQPKATVGTGAGPGATPAIPGVEGYGRTAENLAAYAARLAQPAAAAPTTATGEPGKSKVGELSKDNIKILSNKRTNAVIIMASDSDMKALINIIKDMDIQLAQVLIETVVLDVTLSSGLNTGIDWIQNTKIMNNGKNQYAGGGGGGTGSAIDLAASAVTNLAFSGAQYFFSMPNLNVNAVIQASARDGRTKILTSPVLLTQDNKEATIEATQLRYLFKGYTTVGTFGNGAAQTQANVDPKEIGLTVKVTPRINPTGMVALKVDETYQDIGENQLVDGQNWPTTQTRKLSADIAVKSGETVILGGLVRNEKSSSFSKVPLLGDIPFIGPYLFGSTSSTDSRSELLIFLTPYVQNSSEEGAAEARRRKEYLDVKGMWTKGWSESKLADETISQKIKREQAEHVAARAAEREFARDEDGRVQASPSAVHNVGVMSVTVTTNVMGSATNAVPSAAQGGAGNR